MSTSINFNGNLDYLKSRFPTPILNRISLNKCDERRYTGLCQFHNDHNRSFSLSLNPEGKWLWNCFTCAEGGSVIDFVAKYDECSIKEAIEICEDEMADDADDYDGDERRSEPPRPTPTRVLSFKEEQLQECEQALLNDQALLFLAHRGCYIDVARLLRLGFAEREFHCGTKGCKLCGKYPVLVIPRFWKGQLVGVKYRNIKAPDKNHKWDQEPGSAADFLFLADAEPVDPSEFSSDEAGVNPASKVLVIKRNSVAKSAAASKVVGVFEGELDAILARNLGFNAVAILGTTGVPKNHPSERFQESVALLKSKYEHVVLIGDGDQAGQAAMRLLETYIGEGALFNPVPAPHKDVGDFFESERTSTSWEEAERRVSEWLAKVYGLADEQPALRAPGTPEAKLQSTLRKASATIGKAEMKVIIPALQSELRSLVTFDTAFPKPLGPAALSGIVGEFVTAALPFTEADENCLTYQFLTAVGNMMGRKHYARFGADHHYAGLFTLIVGGTSTGKGQALSVVKSFAHDVDPDWLDKHCRHSAASGEGLVRLAAEVCGKDIPNDEGILGDEDDDFDDWDTEDLAAQVAQQQQKKPQRLAKSIDGRLMLIVPEMSVLLNSMNREGSNISGYLRQGYDRAPLENNKSKKKLIARNYLLSVVGHITPDELQEIMSTVDWYNGISNRFLWAATRKSKTLPRMGKAPNFAKLVIKLNKLLELPAAGAIDFSEAGGKRWDEWVHSLPEMDGKLGASQERIKPNALRVALLYAALDERRLTSSQKKFFIEPEHVEAAIEIVTRSRETVEWFLAGPTQANQKTNHDDLDKVRLAVNKNGGKLTGDDLYRLFSNKSTSERIAIATAAGLKARGQASDGKRGKPATIYTF
jgi:hypothetical protein